MTGRHAALVTEPRRLPKGKSYEVFAREKQVIEAMQWRSAKEGVVGSSRL